MDVNEGLNHNGQYSTATTAEDFRINIAEVNRRIDSAAARAGRDSAEIELLPVSKTVPQERIREAVAAGCRKLGENKRLRTLRDQAQETDPELIGAGKLSMGMSGDYEVAIEEGANCVRVGQAIFGRRALPDSYYWPENG